MSVTTTRLGFGCAQLFQQAKGKQAQALIETALDHGIRHIDVGRSYGDGRAEWVVGDVARSRRDEMFIVTKAGIDPPNLLRRITRKLAAPKGRTNWAPQRPGRFSAEQIAMSSLRSLRALRVQQIDLLLLHECQPDHLTDDLLWMLRRIQADGYVKGFGIATSTEATRTIARVAPEFCEFVQICDDGQHHLPAASKRLITHSIFSPAHRSHRTPALVLTRALQRNPEGTVLFSSSNPVHIAANVHTMLQVEGERPPMR